MSRIEHGIFNAAFAGIVSEVRASDLGLAHEEIFVPVPFDSRKTGRGYYRRYNLAESLAGLSTAALVRRPGSEAFVVGRDRITETFTVTRTHLGVIVPDDEARLMAEQSMGAEDLHVSEVRWARELMLLAQEREAAQLVTNRVVGAAVGTPWTASTADPINDILDAILTVRGQSGLAPNAMALSYPVALTLAAHPKIQSRRGLAERQALTTEALKELLANILGLKKVVVMGAMYVPTRAEGAPVALSEVWGYDFVMLWYEASTPGFNEPTFAVKAEDTSYYDGNRVGVVDIPDPKKEAIEHRIKHDYAFVFIQPEAGIRLVGALAE